MPHIPLSQTLCAPPAASRLSPEAAEDAAAAEAAAALEREEAKLRGLPAEEASGNFPACVFSTLTSGDYIQNEETSSSCTISEK